MKKVKFGKKAVYSILTTIGLMGFATPIAFNVAKNSNYSVAQNANIKNTNFQDSSSTISNNTTTNNSVDTSNADTYNNEFLNDLDNYKNVNYTTTISKLNNGDNTEDTVTDEQQSFEGDLTDNSILATQKDKGELYNEQSNLSSNLTSTLKSAYNTYKNDWYSQLENEFNSTLKDFSDDFYITSLNTEEQFQSSSSTLDTSTDSNWANGSESISPNSSQNLIGQNNFTFQINPRDTSTNGSGNFWINLGGGYTTETETYPIEGEIGGAAYWTTTQQIPIPNDYVMQNDVTITNTNYFFNNINSLLANPSTNSTIINTITNNGDFVGYQKLNLNNTYDYYRGSLNWGIQKSPIYQIDPNTLQLQINTGDGNGFVNVVNSDGTIDTNSQGYKDLLLNNPNIQNDNYYVGDPVDDSDSSTWNGDMTIQPAQYSSFSDYYQQRVKNEQQMLDFYNNNPQLQEFIKNLNKYGQNYNISNNYVTVSSAVPVFGDNNNFSYTEITMPNSVEINADTFNVSQDAFGDNGGLIPKNTAIIFNNFLPILENQIVIDPQVNSEPTYNNPNNAQGVYNVANGIKFKLSENMSKLLSIANLYDEYYDQVNAINPTSYKNQSGLQDALTTFKDLFMKFAFRENNEKAISDILTKLQSSSTINQDLVNEINDLNGNPNYVLGNNSNNNTTTSSTDSNTTTTTYQDNVNEVIKLICEIFNVSSTNYIYNTDANNNSYFNDNVRNVLALLPTAVKDAMSNNIDADINYGDGNIEKNQPIWDANNQQFVTYNLNNTKISDEMAANNESEVSFSNIHFVDKNTNTQDALYNAIDTKDSYNGMDFANNGINTNLNYMLNEYKNYYPSENSITVNGGTITYKIKYNPQYSDWQQSAIDANYNDGIPITPMQDGNGYLATDYTTQDYSKYTTDEIARGKLTNIITSIGNFFANEKIQPTINLNNTTNDLIVLNNNYTGTYATKLNQLKNSYHLDFSGDNDTGVFYVLAKIENSQNFPNPTGDDNGVVTPNKIWYVATDNTNPQIKYYLIKMNATKKTFDLSNISFDMSLDANSNPTTINWEINNTDNYYYTNTTSNSSQIYIQNGEPTLSQTINIDSNTYLAIQNNITNNSAEFYLFRSKINQWFNKYYGVSVVSMNIVANNGNFAINLKLT